MDRLDLSVYNGHTPKPKWDEVIPCTDFRVLILPDRNLLLGAPSLLAEVKKLRAENATLKSDLETNAKLLARQCDMAREAEIVVRNLEWSFYFNDDIIVGHNVMRCPVCRALRVDGHTESCQLATLLFDLDKEPKVKEREIKTNLADWKSDLQEPDLNGWDEDDRKLVLLEYQVAVLKEKLKRAVDVFKSLLLQIPENSKPAQGIIALLADLDAQPDSKGKVEKDV